MTQIDSNLTLHLAPLSLLETNAESQAAEALLNLPWHCDKCEMALTLGPIERLQHRLGCGKKESAGMLSN